MNLKSLKIATLSITAMIFSGCASGLTNSVNKPLSEITSNKNKSYITFARPQFIGAAMSNTVIEFDPLTKETNLIGTLGAQDRIIYETSPGTHYFYMSGGENDDMIKITTENSKMYYVVTQIQFGIMVGRFYFKPVKNSTLKIIDTLHGTKCTNNLLEKYNFEKEINSASELEQYRSNTLNVLINCRGGKINYVNNLISNIEDINDSDLIEPNEKAFEQYKKNLKDYLSEINEDYKEWLKEDSVETEIKKEDGFNL